jgi:MYXO-CTERM domain-containing protein
MAMLMRVMCGMMVVGLVAGVAGAGVIAVANHSFELPAWGDGDGRIHSMTDWPLFGGGFGPMNPVDSMLDGTTGSPGTIPGGDGIQCAQISGNWTTGCDARQLVGTFEAGNIYTLTVAVGKRSDKAFYDFSVQLTDLTTVFAEKAFTAAMVPEGSLQDFDLVWSPSETRTGVYIRFYATSNAGNISSVADNVRLTFEEPQPVAEPAGLGMVGLALLGLKRRRA